MDETQQTVLEAIEKAWNTGKGKQLDDRGRELLDPRPLAPPVGYQKQPSMIEHIRAMVRSEALRQAAEAHGAESFEDADDFDVGDDYDPTSPYEGEFEPIDYQALRAREAQEAENKKGPQPKAGEVAPASAPGSDAAGSKAPPAPPSDSAPT